MSKDSVAAWSRAWAQTHSVVFWFAGETDSTNLRAKEDFAARAHLHPAPILYLSEAQSSGRGRGENIWINPEKGHAFLGSFSFASVQPPQPVLSPLVGLAVYQAFMDVWPDGEWSLKLPNDVLLGAKKVAGILIENVEMGEFRRTVIGLGVNVLATPPGLPEAGSLFDAIGSEHITDVHWQRFLNALYPLLQEALRKGTKTELGDIERKHLLDAVNSNPRLPKKYRDISPQGEPVWP